jgi:hypothetical protein
LQDHEARTTLRTALDTSDPDVVLRTLLSPVTPNEFKRTILERTPRHWRNHGGFVDGLIDEFTVEDPDAVQVSRGGAISV